MTTYKEYIESLSENGGKNELFYNSCEEHATIVLKNIVKNAKTDVKAICGNMCSEVSNDPEYIDIVKNFLAGDSNRKFKVLFDSNYNEDFLTKPIALALATFGKQVEIRKLRSGYLRYRDEETDAPTPVHITVSDDKAYRFETDIEKKMARGNFNDPKNSKVFSNVFDNYFTDEHSVKVSL